MNSPRFDRFSQPDYLQRIGRERVTGMLLPFASELLGLGIALPAAALPDDVFFIVLAAVARRPEGLSAPLLDAMTAIEVLDQIFPDEVPAAPCPLVVTELRLRLGVKSRPILFSPAADPGLLDGGMTGLRIENEGHLTPALSPSGGEGGVGAINGGLKLAEGAVPYFVVSVAEPRPSKEDGGSKMENGVTEVETARGVLADGHQPRPTKTDVPPHDLLAELREQRILLAKLNAQVGSLAKELPARAEGESPGPVNEAGAVAVFALIVKLDAQGKQKAPSPLTVFRHYCIEGLSAEQVATKCRCAKGTVMGRLRLIERATRKKPESFRAMSDHLQRLDDTYSNTGARDIYRRGLADGDES